MSVIALLGAVPYPQNSPQRISVCNQVAHGKFYYEEPGQRKSCSHCSFKDFHSHSKGKTGFLSKDSLRGGGEQGRFVILSFPLFYSIWGSDAAKNRTKSVLSHPFLCAPNASKNKDLRAVSPNASRQSTGKMTPFCPYARIHLSHPESDGISADVGWGGVE